MLKKNELFTLDNFEGTLDFLLCLIQKDELDIYEIPIQNLIEQFLVKFIELQKDSLEEGAEFISAASYLVWLKSKTLLPSHEQDPFQQEEVFEDPRFEIIHHLLDYCRFKQAAKELTTLQDKQQGCYFRGIDTPEWKKPLGIDHVSLEELSHLFMEMMERASKAKPLVHEEEWKVSDKIQFIRRSLREGGSFPIAWLLKPEKSRVEIIVIFLAVLELMKSGELAVGKEQETGALIIFPKREEAAG